MVLKVSLNTGINRIRLEFKGAWVNGQEHILTVLIESDWNLKLFQCDFFIGNRFRINRIRLEFKGYRAMYVGIFYAY